MTDYPKVTFGIIVLNGEPFTKYCLRSLYPFAHEIIVVEGAIQQAKCVSTTDGHSRDGTLQSLREFKEDEDPENKLRIITTDGFWSEKDEQSQAYAKAATGDYLWQVDIDEFYMPKDMDCVLRILKNIPDISAVSFKQITFWGDICYRCDSTYPLLNGTEPVHRIFKFGKGYRYITHRPPTVVDAEGINLRDKKYLNSDIMASKGIFFYHYSLLFPKQVRDKVTYYRNLPFEHCRLMPRWAQENYHRISNPFNVHNVHTHPSWLERYSGEHPHQIYNMISDIRAGILNVETRCNSDVEEFIDNPKYCSGINFIKQEYARRNKQSIKIDDPVFNNKLFQQFITEYTLKRHGLDKNIVDNHDNQFDTATKTHEPARNHSKTTKLKSSLLNLGCGNRYHPDWMNMDFRQTGADVTAHNLYEGVPFEDNTFDVVYHSHLLEHFPKNYAPAFLQECYRVLKPGGILRVVVPDLEQIARWYLALLEKSLQGDKDAQARYEWIMLELCDQMVRNVSGGEMLAYWKRNPIPAESFVIERAGSEVLNVLNDIRGKGQEHSSGDSDTIEDLEPLQIGQFRLSGEIHQWMYDGYSLGRLLSLAGFKQVKVCRADESSIPDFNCYLLDIEPDGSVRKPDSLFMEGRK